MAREELYAEYTRLKGERAKDLDALKARDRAISYTRVVCLLAAAAGLGVSVWSSYPRLGTFLTAGGVLAFIVLVIMHVRLDERMHRFEAAVSYFDRGLFRLDLALSKLTRSGEKHLTPSHPYADDLDVFGKESLFTLLDSTETEFGEETLATWLSGKDAPTIATLRERQDAVRDAAARTSLREEFSVVGSLLNKPDPRPFVKWVERPQETLVPGVVAFFARAIPVISITLFGLGQAGILKPYIWLLSVACGYAMAAVYAEKTREIVNAASTKQSGLRRFAALFRLLDDEKFTSTRLLGLQAELRASGATASLEMDRLGRITGFLDARENEVFRALIAPIFLWDLNCAISLFAWKQRTHKAIGAWFRVLGEIEALFSLAVFFVEQDAVFPELVEEGVFEAEALGHPLLSPKRRVVNDVTLAPALIVTGSNMSGKSTLLRTIGVNALLARIGAPVVAKKLRIGPLSIATSIRVRDSLGDGVSRFYAELGKIKTVVDTAKNKAPSLFLLDEVLAGTNARERVSGGKSIVRALLAANALGAVSTHDLELTKLEDETNGSTKNVHFEEQVQGDTMTFDYRLRMGVVTTSNALRLMKALGLPVDA